MRQKMRYFLLLVGLLLSVSIGAQTVKWRDIYTVRRKILSLVSPINMD